MPCMGQCAVPPYLLLFTSKLGIYNKDDSKDNECYWLIVKPRTIKNSWLLTNIVLSLFPVVLFITIGISHASRCSNSWLLIFSFPNSCPPFYRVTLPAQKHIRQTQGSSILSHQNVSICHKGLISIWMAAAKSLFAVSPCTQL